MVRGVSSEDRRARDPPHHGNGTSPLPLRDRRASLHGRNSLVVTPTAPTTIDSNSGPPHDLWFSHRRIGFLTLDGPRPVVDVDAPSLVALPELHKDTNLITQPALETT
jgi:hypothetical protein